jgi:hypothetical protein
MGQPTLANADVLHTTLKNYPCLAKVTQCEITYCLGKDGELKNIYFLPQEDPDLMIRTPDRSGGSSAMTLEEFTDIVLASEGVKTDGKSTQFRCMFFTCCVTCCVTCSLHVASHVASHVEEWESRFGGG